MLIGQHLTTSLWRSFMDGSIVRKRWPKVNLHSVFGNYLFCSSFIHIIFIKVYSVY